MKSLYLLSTFFFFLISTEMRSQDLILTNDTICVNEGDPLNFNVLLNDMIPMGYSTNVLPSGNWDACFRINELGILTFSPQGKDCCGVYDLIYRVIATNPTSQQMSTAHIFITVKCPKPNCTIVDLEETNTSPIGGQGKKIFYACENTPVTYYVSYVPTYTYTWIIGPGGTSSSGVNNAEIIVTWSNPGANTITLITNNGVSSSTEIFCVEILPAPVASFTKSSAYVCLNSPISFTNTSTGASSYYWDFGDGNNSTMPNPTHNYGSPGTFTVTLFAYSTNYDPMGNPLCCCVDSMQMQVIVDDKPGPNIYWISTLCEGDTSKYWTDAVNCTFTWTVTTANGSPIPFLWQGNDTICVVWPSGPYGVITLDISNCSPAIYCELPVTVNVPIISSIETIKGKPIVCANSKEPYTLPKWPGVIYDWTVTGGMIVSGDSTHEVIIMWGNGPTGTIHVDYWSPFLQGLPGHDGEECTGSADLNVVIRPKYALNPTPTVVCVGSVSNLSTNMSPPLGFTWTTNPLITGFPMVGVNSVSITWPNTGVFKVCVYPNNPTYFCNDTICIFITVVGMPPPDSITGQKSICPGQSYTYFANSAINNVSFQWSVINGVLSSPTGNPVTVIWNNNLLPASISLTQTDLSNPFCTSLPIICNINKKILNGPLTLSSAPLCTNSTQSYTCGPIQDPEAVFTWSIIPASAGSVVSGQGNSTAMIQWNNTPGPVMLKCVVTICNQTNMIIKSLTLSAPISPIITQTGNLCPGGTAFLNLTGGVFAPISWSTGSVTPTISISAAGTYVVTTTDVNMCTAITTYVANNVQGPNASISTPDIVTYCVKPNITQPNVTITALTNPNYNYQWYCNGVPQGLAPNANMFVHTSSMVIGSFVYYVVVTDVTTGCMKISNNIIVNQLDCNNPPPPPCVHQAHNVTITANTTTPFCNVGYFNVAFTNATLLGWNFGDIGGNTNAGSLQNAVHTFSTAGYYLTTLTYSVPNSVTVPPMPPCILSKNASICIPVAADFDIDLVTCRTYNFTNLSSYIPGNTISSYFWTFGDGNTSILANPTHTYTTCNTFTVTLTVTTSTGCQASWTQTINAPCDPVALFTKAPNPACVGVGVKFTPTVNPAIISYLWNFGDLSNNAAVCPSHSYLTSGTYNTSLTIVDNNGCSNTSSMPLIVHPVFMPDTIVYTPSLTVCFGDTVTLTAPVGSSYIWNNGVTTAMQSITATGFYGVTVTDANGCTGVPDSVEVVILPPVLAQIAGSHTICDNGCITLSASLGFGYNHQWYDESGLLIPGATNPTFQICKNSYHDSVYVKITQLPSMCMETSAWWTIDLAISPTVVINVISGNLCAGSPSLLMAVATPLANIIFSWSTGALGASIIAIQEGTYTVYATDTITGCSDNATVIVNPLPDLCIMPTGCYTACNPDTLCGPSGMFSYQWNMNGIPIPGATMQCYIVTQSGSYSLTAVNNFMCTATSDTLILVLIPCCDENDTEVTAMAITPTVGDCCYKLSYTNSQDSLMSVTISTNDADITMIAGSLIPPFAIGGITANSITLTNITIGVPLPMGNITNFIKICASNITTSPVVIDISWDWPDYEMLCQDSIVLECDIISECVYITDDSLSCGTAGGYNYTFTVCNPSDNTFSFGYIDFVELAPPGLTVTLGFFDLGITPLDPGDCQTFIINIAGNNLPNKDFCFNIVVHEQNPLIHPNSICCSLDSIYCLPFPGCTPCDSVFVENVVPTKEDSCCYNITLNNYHDINTYAGVQICSLSGGTTLNVNNFVGSGWTLFNYSPTNFVLEYTAGFMPLGVFTLPSICVATSNVAFNDVEIKWLGYGIDGYIVLCRDSIELFCPGDCGYYNNEVTCNDDNTFNIQLTFHNTSADTIYSASIIFSDPLLIGYNQTISMPGILPGGTFGPININLGPPAVSGNSITFITTLHNRPGNLSITCCQFKTVIVLPPCSTDPEPCMCDEEFEHEVSLGFSALVTGQNVVFTPLGNLTDCDKVIWEWIKEGTTSMTIGNQSVMHQFPGNGEWKVCMTVVRTTADGKQCKVKVTKEVIISGPFQLLLQPNPASEMLGMKLKNNNEQSEIKNYQIINMSGYPVQTGQSTLNHKNFTMINVNSLKNGVYYIKVYNDTQFVMKKFVKIE